MSDYWKKKLEELNQSKKTTTTSSSKSTTSSSSYWEDRMDELKSGKKKDDDDDIAPVKTVGSVSQKTKDDEEDDDLKWYQKGHFEDGWDFGDVTKTILGISPKKEVKTFTAPETTDTLEQLKQKQEYYAGRTWKSAEQREDAFKVTQQYNQMALAQYSDTLSKTKMDGQNHTVLEEIGILANMKSGEEKDKRKQAVLDKMESLGMDTSFYSHFAGDGEFDWGTFGKWLGNSALAGLNTFNKGLLDTADVLLGAPLKALGWENNPISKGAEYYGDLYSEYRYNANILAEKLGGNAWNFGTDFVEGTAGAVPFAIQTMMSAGTNMLPTAQTLINQAAYRAGNVLTKAGLTVESMMKNPQFWTSFSRSLGSDYKEAKENGASDVAATIGSVLKSFVNAGIEIGPGGDSGIQGLPQGIKEGGKPFWEWIESSIEEGGEEMLQKFVGEIINKIGYGSEDEILNPIEYAKEGAIGTLSGMALGGGQIGLQSAANAYAEHQANKPTANEKAVIKREVEKRIAEAEKKGEKLTAREKSKIEEQVTAALEKGYIAIDTIEEVLGGDSRAEYESLKKESDEFDSLYDTTYEKLSEKQRDRLAELKAKNEKTSYKDALKASRQKMYDSVYELAKGDRLVESYNEEARKKQDFVADFTKVKSETAKKTLQNIVNSKLANNSNEFHDFVDLMTRVSDDRDIEFDITDNDGLKGTAHQFEGRIVDAFISGDNKKVTINLDSPKALNFLVGHEVTHSFEGNQKLYKDLQDALFTYANSKGDMKGTPEELAKQYEEKYEGVSGANHVRELTADMVGQYLFRDADFITHLSANHRNVFQKVYDEIKYLVKVATAGSKAARDLERVKKQFDKVYRDMTQAENGSDTKYALENNGKSKYNKHSRYSETETLFMRWEKGSAPVGEVKRFTRFGKTHYYEKTENGCVELSKSQYRERSGANAENTYRRAERRLGTTNDYDESAERTVPGYHNGYRDSRGNATVFGQAISEKLRHDTARGASSTNGHTGRNGINQTEYNDEASDDSGASFVTFSNDYATVRNHMKDGDTSQETDSDPVKYSLSDSDGNQLTQEQAEFFKDSKIRDNEGNLRRVYHTTKHDFTVFDHARKGEATDGPNTFLGFFFAESPDHMEQFPEFQGGKTEAYYLDMKKPMDLTNLTRESFMDIVELTGGDRTEAAEVFDQELEAEKARARFRGDNNTSLSISQLLYNMVGDYYHADFFDALKPNYDKLVAKGYDGVIDYLDEMMGEREFVVFESNQAKLTSNTNPSADPDIRHSLSFVDEVQEEYGDYNVYGKDVKVQKPVDEIAPVAENATTTEDSMVVGDETTPTVSETESVAGMFLDEPTPQIELDALNQEKETLESRMLNMANSGDFSELESINERWMAVQARIEQLDNEISATESERINSLDDADAPMELDAPYYGEPSKPESAPDPFMGRDMDEVAKSRKTKAYQYENPEVKPYFMDAAYGMLGDLNETVRGEKIFNGDVHYESGGEKGWMGTKRQTTDDIAWLKDTYGYTYDQIRDGVNAIIEDDGKENNAVSKRIEFLLHDRLVNGYTGVWGEPIPPNQEYISFLKEREVNEYSREAFDSFMATADQYAPMEDIAPVQRKPGYVSTSSEQMKLPLYHDPNNVLPAMDEVRADGDLAPVFETESGQQSLLENSVDQKTVTRKELHASIMDNIKAQFAERGFDFDQVLKDAKNLSTFATVDNTPQRVLEKSLGYKAGQILSDLTVDRVAQNETEGIKWLNSFTDRNNGLLAQISKKYNIKPGSKESAAAQMYAEGFYVNDKNEIIQYGDPELVQDFPDAKVRANIKGLARDPRIRKIYDDTLAAINESRARNAYPEIQKLDNYFLHFRAMDDTFSRLGLPFNPNDIKAKDLPTDLNGVTADLKPGQPYFASAMHRTGKRTSFDLLGGLERYLSSAKNQIYHIDDIQTLRALRNYVAETYGQGHGLEGLDLMTEEEAEERIKQVYDSHLSTFAKFLNEEANVIAGKTALIDRGLEGIIGRRGITFLNTINKQVGANMVGFNISSSMTNFLAPVQAFAKTNKADFVKAFAQTVSNKVGSIFGRTDGFAEQSPVVIRRKGEERFYRTPYQKISDAGYVLMGAVDDISTELIARTKYNELTRKGMDPQAAHIVTDKWVSRLMGDRSLGQQPQLYNSKMLGIVTKFQLEVRNQLDSQFYDTIQETKVSNEEIQNGLLRNAKTAAKVASTFVQLAVVQHLFGKAFESVAGYNPAFDIISAIVKAFGWDDDEEDEDTVLDNIEQGFFELMGDMPYVSTLTGGRIPISSALPIEELYKGEDQYGNEKSRWETLAEAAPYYILPGGYGQVKKTKAGLDMFSDEHPIAGSYTDSGNLRFPVEDTLPNRIQAGLFGQYASQNARDYFDNDYAPLKEKQIQEYIDSDMPIRDYWKYREGLSGLENLSEQADYINGLDLPIGTKNLLINNIAGRKEPIDLTGYDDFGSFEEFDFAVKNPEKYEIAQAVGGYAKYMTYREGMKDMKLEEKVDYVAGLNLTTKQKNILINGETDRKEPIDLTGYENFDNFEEFEFAKENPESYAVAKAVGGYKAYKQYSADLNDIKADKDKYGKTISGSRKTKVMEYINSLDADYYTKLILYKSEYTSYDDENYEIIEYLNGRKDISFEEEIDILRKLGFSVTAEGNISW